MVWDAISVDSRAPLVVLRGTLTAEWYVDDILRTVLLQLLLQYSGFIFQQDNAKSHTARDAMNCLRACQTLPWPARSPNLCLVVHVWDIMGRRLIY
ncbi:transposable element Tc1 transposase [Trichonephila clavipes]|nr:transposable element Tc1 transposase [Trichonephila clavipes]